MKLVIPWWGTICRRMVTTGGLAPVKSVEHEEYENTTRDMEISSQKGPAPQLMPYFGHMGILKIKN